MKLKAIALLVFTGLFSSCNTDSRYDFQSAENSSQSAQSTADSSCTVVSDERGAKIICPDGSEALIEHGHNGQDGTNGLNGIDGVDGANGHSCTISSLSPTEALIECGDGTQSVLNLTVPSAAHTQGLVLWLDSSDPTTLHKSAGCDSQAANGDEILCWADKSGNANAKALSSRGPLLDADGADFRSASSESMEVRLKERLRGDDYTVFLVADLDLAASNTDARFVSLFAKGVRSNEATSSSSSIALRKKDNWLVSSHKSSVSRNYSNQTQGTKIYSVSLSSGTKFLYRDSSNRRTSSTVSRANLDVDRIRLMVGNNKYGQGTIKELLVFDRKLSESEFLAIYVDLQKKWELAP